MQRLTSVPALLRQTMGRSGRNACTAALSVALVPATAAAAAPAASAIRYVGQGFTVPGNFSFALPVACPAGTRIVGNSFRRGIAFCPADRYAFGGSGYFVTTNGQKRPAAFNNVVNAPTDGGNGWWYSATPQDNSDTLEVVVQCAPKTGRDYILRNSVLVNGDEPRDGNFFIDSVYATCPAGYVPISGGFYISSFNSQEATPAFVYYSVPVNHNAGPIDSWFVQASAEVGKSIFAKAQCIF